MSKTVALASHYQDLTWHLLLSSVSDRMLRLEGLGWLLAHGVQKGGR